MKGVLLAAGLGTRMRPLTHRRPKGLVPLLDKPILQHMLERGAAAGVEHWLVVIGHWGDQIRDYFGDGRAFGTRLEYVVQERLDGNSTATLLAQDFVGDEPFFLQYADIITPAANYQRLVDEFNSGRWELVMSLNWVEDPYRGGAVYLDAEGRVTRIIEKPAPGTSTTHYNNAGLYVFRPSIFEAIRQTPISERGEYELAQAVGLAVGQGRAVGAIQCQGYWSDVASPAELLRLQPLVIEEHVGPGGQLIAPSAQVARGARLGESVALAELVQVGESHIGPNVSLGSGSKVGDGCRLVHSFVLAGADIQNGCHLRNVVVEEGATVPADTVHHGQDPEPTVLGAVCGDSR